LRVWPRLLCAVALAIGLGAAPAAASAEGWVTHPAGALVHLAGAATSQPTAQRSAPALRLPIAKHVPAVDGVLAVTASALLGLALFRVCRRRPGGRTLAVTSSPGARAPPVMVGT